ncbi:hypothetical protein [Streptomyces sp. NPDC002172]
MTDSSARAAVGAAALRDLLEHLDADAVVQRMEPELRRMPEYVRVARNREASALRPALRRQARLLLHWMVSGSPPDAYVLSETYERAREYAAAGEPLDAGLLLHHRGVRVFWDAVLGLATEREPARPADWPDQGRRLLDGYLDMVTRIFAQAYADQADLPSAQGDRRAHTLFERLCTRLPVTVEDQERAARLGFDLTPPYVPFVLLLDKSAPADRSDLAARLRTAGALAFVEDVHITGLTRPAFEWSGFLTDRRLLLAQGLPTGRTGLRTAVDNLRMLVAVASRSQRRGRVRVEDSCPGCSSRTLPNSPTR